MADTRLGKIGITPKGAWVPADSYELLDMVLYAVENDGDGCSYIALKPSQNVTPGTDPTTWQKSTQAGQSIYDLAVKYHHFEGTEEEFEAEYQAVLQAARDAAASASAVESQIETAEAARVAAESDRASAESTRQSAETARGTAETERQSAETSRASAEQSRADAESARQTAESSRATAEQSRAAAETTRQNNETSRTQQFQALEADMQTAIANVDAKAAEIQEDIEGYEANEAARVSAETARATAEAQRVSAETARASAETARESAETARVAAEGQRASAETARASAETSRASAETARETQASSDHSRAESDHSTAASDHSTAGSDHTRAESDHAIAAQDHATLDEKIAHKADIDGSYEQMSVGTAKNLEGRSEVTDSFLERTTGGDAEVANGLAQITEVKGKSQAWNQIVDSLNVEKYLPTGPYSAVISISDGIIGMDFSSQYQGRVNKVETVEGHAYYATYSYKTSVANIYCGFGAFNSGGVIGFRVSTVNTDGGWKRIQGIFTAGSKNNDWGFFAQVRMSGVTGHVDFKDVFLIDLTLLGIDNLTTVAEVEAWLASNVGLRDHYPYDPGSVLNVKMKGLESLGFNLLDPSTGKARIIGAYSDVYGNYYGITGTHGTLTFTSDLGETSTITPDSDGKFLLETPGWLDVATPGADCAVFLWWDGTRTEYEDYDREVANLDVTHIYGKLNGEGSLVQVWPNGMPGVNDVKDVLRLEDGVPVARRRNGEVDMGTLDYELLSGIFRSVAELPAKDNGAYVPVKAINTKYEQKPRTIPYSSLTDKQYKFDSGNMKMCFNDASSSSAAQFKSNNTGVRLYYELATEQVFTDLVYQGSDLFADGTPVTLPVPYIVNNWGLERVIPQNPAEGPITSAPEISIKYGVDAVEQLDTIRTSGVFVEDLKANLQALLAVVNDKLGATMGGTIAIGSTPTDKVYPFTFVPTPEPEPTNEGE